MWDGGTRDGARWDSAIPTDGSSDRGGRPPQDGSADHGGPLHDGSTDSGSKKKDAAPPGTLKPGTSTLTLQVAGRSRSVYLNVPAAVANGPAPLVIALHGDGDTSRNFVTATGLVTDSNQEGFVLAAPQGITRSVAIHEGGQVIQTIPNIDWDPYNSIQSNGAITSADNIDVPLLDAIRKRLVASGSIQVKHIIVYGYSQGGYLSFRYGMSDAADIACAAVLAAAHPLPGTQLIEQASRKTPVFIQIGTNDSAYSNAQSTVQELKNNGNPVQFNVIQGAGHVPPPGNPKTPLDYCLKQSL